ncbi:Uncharacterized protein dnm_026300 [Desulfonema magnum]|uniref:Uncharacterized protein n=1 Tax=Desulfonema magnum TaxID=45655 RepID=A0A975GM73_9BACT|nr:Uncharacterized protein dnm_026300 [Desulfonema magnum]
MKSVHCYLSLIFRKVKRKTGQPYDIRKLPGKRGLVYTDELLSQADRKFFLKKESQFLIC